MSTNRAKESVMKDATAVVVICGQCGVGVYARPLTGDADFVCTVCAHEMSWDDFAGHTDDGEVLDIRSGVLHVVQS